MLPNFKMLKNCSVPPVSLNDWYMFLRACVDVLAGEHSYLCTPLTKDRSSPPLGRSSSSTECAASGRTHVGRWGRKGHRPSQLDQPSQPWWSLGWQMLQPDGPHIHMIHTFKVCIWYYYSRWKSIIQTSTSKSCKW